jgi:hypothetical protein
MQPSAKVIAVLRARLWALCVAASVALGTTAVAGLVLGAACIVGLVNKHGLVVAAWAATIIFGVGPLAGLACIWLHPSER